MAEQLHVFEYSDGCDYVIARDGADADAIFRDRHRTAIGEDEMRRELESRWDMGDADALKVWWHEGRAEVTDSGDGVLTERTNAEWAALVGRGWFCSTEW